MSKTSKTKILFVSTDVRQTIGYGRISHKILNYLAQDKTNEIYHFAFSDYEPTRTNRYINPSIKVINVIEEEKKIGSSELYGKDLIVTFMDMIKPDLLFIYNDLVVVGHLFNSLLDYRAQNTYFKTAVYIDLVYDYERYDLIKHLDRNSDIIFVFNEYWKQNLINMEVDENKIKVFNHGIDTDQIHKVNKLEARKQLGLNESDFIFLNTNRNSYRKGWDITISAFIKLLKRHNCNPNIKLYVNCLLQILEGYMIIDLIKIECLRNNLDFLKVINTNFLMHSSHSGRLSDEHMNYLYNACDVGINTCVGEGFGLCNLEHGYLGVPQVVSNVGGLREIFKNGHSKVIEPVAELYIANNIDSHGGFIKVCNSEDFTNAMEYYMMNDEIRIEDGKELEKDLSNRFKWDNLLTKFKQDLYIFLGKMIMEEEEEKQEVVDKNFKGEQTDEKMEKVKEVKEVEEQVIEIDTDKLKIFRNKFSFVN